MKIIHLVLSFTLLSLGVTAQNLGIGTLNPQQRLHVNGQVAIDSVLSGSNTDSLVTINKSGTPGGVLRAVSVSAFQGNSWLRLGNSGTNPALHFLGTLDNQPLRLRLNNRWAGELNPVSSNYFIGDSAGIKITTSATNVGIGAQTLKNNTTGYRNVAIGHRALRANISGDYNVAIGGDALLNNETGYFNTAVGQSALYWNTTGYQNAAVGYEALVSNTTGSNNTAMGFQSALNITTGSDNAVFGFKAMFNNTTGNQNTAVGKDALFNMNGGSGNTGIGYRALYSMEEPSNNTAIGNQALANLGQTNVYENNSNVAIGYQAGSNLISGRNNILIGAGVQAANLVYNDMIAIGTNQIIARVPVSWTTSSDRRLKTDIRNLPLGLDLISRLRPVDYHRINAEEGSIEIGFIAQEVEAALKESGYTGKGIVSFINADGILGVRYNDFIPLLVKGMQEQQEQIKQLQKQIADLVEKQNRPFTNR